MTIVNNTGNGPKPVAYDYNPALAGEQQKTSIIDIVKHFFTPKGKEIEEGSSKIAEVLSDVKKAKDLADFADMFKNIEEDETKQKKAIDNKGENIKKLDPKSGKDSKAKIEKEPSEADGVGKDISIEVLEEEIDPIGEKTPKDEPEKEPSVLEKIFVEPWKAVSGFFKDLDDYYKTEKINKEVNEYNKKAMENNEPLKENLPQVEHPVSRLLNNILEFFAPKTPDSIDEVPVPTDIETDMVRDMD